MAKRLFSLIEISFILIIALVVSACSQGTLIDTPAPSPTPATITKTPSPANLISSKPIVLPGDIITAISAAIINFTLEDLIKVSDTAVTGKVTAILPAKQDENRSPQTYFYTDVVIQVERYLYGQPQSKQIAVRVDGGRIGNIVMMAGDEAEFTLGEECTVFLGHRSYVDRAPEGFTNENYYSVWFGAWGKYHLNDMILVGLDRNYSLSDIDKEIAKTQKK